MIKTVYSFFNLRIFIIYRSHGPHILSCLFTNTKVFLYNSRFIFIILFSILYTRNFVFIFHTYSHVQFSAICYFYIVPLFLKPLLNLRKIFKISDVMWKPHYRTRQRFLLWLYFLLQTKKPFEFPKQ